MSLWKFPKSTDIENRWLYPFDAEADTLQVARGFSAGNEGASRRSDNFALCKDGWITYSRNSLNQIYRSFWKGNLRSRWEVFPVVSRCSEPPRSIRMLHVTQSPRCCSDMKTKKFLAPPHRFSMFTTGLTWACR